MRFDDKTPEEESLVARARKAELSTRLEKLAKEAREIIAAGVPKNTRRTYNAQWRGFFAWCDRNDRQSLPTEAETLILYLTDRSKEVKVSTLNVALAAITVAHREAGHTDWAASDLPGVRVFMRGLRRTRGKGPEKKRALSLVELRQGLPEGDSTKAIRDRALLLTGFFAALRRSELVALDVEDVQEIPTGIRLAIWHSKTDKQDEGHVVSLPFLSDKPLLCPVSALRCWLKKREEGPLFISMRGGSRLQEGQVAEIVKKAVKQAGLDPRHYAGHSLRSGFVTEAARSRAEERDIMNVTRHRSERTLRGYIQEATLGENHPGRKIVTDMYQDDDLFHWFDFGDSWPRSDTLHMDILYAEVRRGSIIVRRVDVPTFDSRRWPNGAEFSGGPEHQLLCAEAVQFFEALGFQRDNLSAIRYGGNRFWSDVSLGKGRILGECGSVQPIKVLYAIQEDRRLLVHSGHRREGLLFSRGEGLLVRQHPEWTDAEFEEKLSILSKSGVDIGETKRKMKDFWGSK